jgi:hypothetical protein
MPRDPDPASKLDIGALRAWWLQQEEDGAKLIQLVDLIRTSWPGTLPPDSWYIVIVGTYRRFG